MRYKLNWQCRIRKSSSRGSFMRPSKSKSFLQENFIWVKITYPEPRELDFRILHCQFSLYLKGNCELMNFKFLPYFEFLGLGAFRINHGTSIFGFLVVKLYRNLSYNIGFFENIRFFVLKREKNGNGFSFTVFWCFYE